MSGALGYISAFRPNPAAGGNLTVDLWAPIETLLPTAANLKSSASGPAVAASAWSITGIQLGSASAEKATLSTINTASDPAAYGYVGNHNVPNYFTIDLNTYPTTQSVGLWFQVTTLSAGTYCNPWVFGESTAPGLSIATLRVANNAGVYTAYLFNGGGSSGTVTISAATWYWATAKAVQSGTCTLAIYSASGVQVGSNQTVIGSANQPFYHSLGGIASSSGTGDTYVDDFVIDKTTAAFPLGP